MSAIEIRLPRPMLIILTSPGYLFEANICGKKKEVSTCIKHLRSTNLALWDDTKTC